MARTISKTHADHFVTEWRARLLDASLDTGRPSQQRDRFAALLGLRNGALQKSKAAQVARGLSDYHSALRADRMSQLGEFSAIDAWIVRFLLRPGSELLTSEAMRLACLARIRDRRRRQAHTKQGRRAATIEMSEDAWARLGRVRDTRALPTLGAAVAALLDDATGSKAPARKPRRDRRVDANIQPDLLQGKNAPPHVYRQHKSKA